MSTALEVKRVPHSEDLLHPGDYVFIGKREPRRTFHSVAIEPPLERPDGTVIGDAFRYLSWKLFGKKFELKPIVESVWPDIDTVIVNCPACNQAFATTQNHKILSVEPLTLNIPLTCPYCKTNTFKIEEGKISAA